VSAPITGLAPATSYSVTLTATSGQGTGSGAAVSFTTLSPTAPATVAPTVTGLTVSPSRFRRGRHAATLARARSNAHATPTGTTISFQLSRAATVTLGFQQQRTGVLSGHRCAAPTKAHRRGHPCVLYTTLSQTVTRAGHVGADRLHFEGVLDGGFRLAPGAYRIWLRATNAGGTASAPQRPTLTLLP
jgi:hypothetical protein